MLTALHPRDENPVTPL